MVGLLRRGHLKEYLSSKSKGTYSKAENKALPLPPPPEPSPPPQMRTCNVINGGSEVSGVTYSVAKVAKRHAREAATAEGKPRRAPSNFTGQTISFVDDEASDLPFAHHDALVISLLVSNCMTNVY